MRVGFVLILMPYVEVVVCVLVLSLTSRPRQVSNSDLDALQKQVQDNKGVITKVHSEHMSTMSSVEADLQRLKIARDEHISQVRSGWHGLLLVLCYNMACGMA